MDIQSKQPLLSICIPTYNRATILKQTLENITSDPDFSDDIEVIISDNASSDETNLVAKDFQSRFSNVKYFRNQENVRDQNFTLALERASGKYLKLSNDTVTYSPGAFKQMLDIIRSRGENTTPLYFSRGDSKQRGNKLSQHSLEELTATLREGIGWIGSFGLLRSDIDCLNVDEKYTKMHFVQVAWLLEIFKKHGQIDLYPGDWYILNEPPKKGKYNLFEVQTTNLLSILRDYGLKGMAYEKLKYAIFRKFYLPLYCTFVLNKKPTNFDLSHSLWTLFKSYWYTPYFYAGIGLNYLRKLKKT